MTLHEIAALLEDPADGDDEENDFRREDIQEIIKIPPTDDQETDEDSDDENGGNLNHLFFTSAQLLTECEVVLVCDINCAATEVNEVDSKEKRKCKKVYILDSS